ncbi:MAG: leucine-rich repeat protein [Clostridia bacterium]|nr:leucine-rich repeat protein [Clostridia bacterium]
MFKKYLNTVLLVLACVFMVVAVFAAVPENVATSQAQTIKYTQSNVSELFTTEQANELVSSFYADVTADFIEEIPEDQAVWAFIQTKGVCLADCFIRQEKYGSFSEYALSFEGMCAESALLEGQLSVVEQLKSTGIDAYVKYYYTYLTNSMGVMVRYGDLDKIAALKNVENVFLAPEYNVPEVSTDDYSGDANVQSGYMQSTGILSNSTDYQGEGMVVGIIDTGLDYNLSAFAVEPKVQALQKDDIATLLSSLKGKTADDVYVSGKIPYAYDYADKDYDVCPSDYSVLNYNNSHGTHVAGIVAGNDEVIQGVVPNAQLCIFKVFSDASNGANTVNIVAALNDAIVLNVDVINLSLGTYSGYSTEYDASMAYINTVYKKLDEIGISVCASCGNNFNTSYGSALSVPSVTNPDYGIVGSPGSYLTTMATSSADSYTKSYITVGDKKLFFNEAVNSNSVKYDFVGGVLGDSEEISLEMVSVGYGTEQDYSGIDVKGKVAVMSRGNGSFATKQDIAAKYGAVACIIYNNAAGTINMQIINLQIPCCSISQDEGEWLMNNIGTVKIAKNQRQSLFLSSFASWGCTPEMDLKPDITAPGGQIYSTVPSAYGTNYAYMSGTSMSSPNMAGAMAAIRQYVKDTYPSYSQVDIYKLATKLAMCTAIQCEDTNGIFASVRHQGAGLVNISGATSTKAYIAVENSTKTKLELGEDVDKEGKYTLIFSVVNTSDESIVYDISVAALCDEVSSDGFSLTQLSHMLEASSCINASVTNAEIDGLKVTIAANQTAKIRVSICLSEADVGYLAQFPYGTFVEGYCLLTSEENDLSVPFFAFYGSWAEAPMFDNTVYDEEGATVYASRMLAVYNNYQTLLTMGAYVYELPEGQEAVPTESDKCALSYDLSGNFMLYSVYMGMFRNASNLSYTFSDAVTDSVILQGDAGLTRKAGISGSSFVPTAHLLQFMPSDFGLYNNQKISLTVEATFLNDEDGINARNVYEYWFYIDTEAPTQYSADFYTEGESTFLDLGVYDNHYLMDIQLYSYAEDGVTLISLSDYAIPVIDFKRNENNNITLDLTEYADKIFDNKIIVYTQDYAMNFVAVEYTIDAEENTEPVDVKHNEKQAGTVGEGMYQGTYSVNGEGVTFTTTEYRIDAIAPYSTDELKETSSEVDFTIVDKVLLSYSGYAKHVIIPEGVVRIADGILDNYIGSSVFGSHKEIEKVTIPDSCQYIGLAAFAHCTSLKECNLPLGVLTLKEAAFYDCSSLESIVIPESVKQYGRGVFYKCTLLKNVTINSTANMNNDYMFGYCFGLEEITIPEGVTIIGNYFFYGAIALKRVHFPTTLTDIYSNTFRFCAIEELNLSDTALVALNFTAFASCEQLTKVSLPSTLTTLGEGVFSYCDRLSDINLEESSVNVIQRAVFTNCVSLEEIKLPNTCTELSTSCFYDCKSLKKIALNSQLRNIGNSVFKGCFSLLSINLEDTRVQNISAYAFSECSSLKSVILPRFLTGSIDTYAFTDTSISCITLLGSYQPTIGVNAFGLTDSENNIANKTNYAIYVKDGIYKSCKNDWTQYSKYIFNLVDYDLSTSTYTLNSYNGSAKNIIMPSAVKNIGAGAFEGNTTIESIYIPYGLSKIGERAFKNTTALQSIDIPSTCTDIGAQAFMNSSVCDVTVRSATPPALGDSAFAETSESLVLRVPNDALELYRNAEGWSELSDKMSDIQQFVIKDGVLFEYVGESSRVVIPDSVTSIAAKAFYGDCIISEVVVGANVVSIGEQAFAKCSNLTSVIFTGTKLKTIDRYAFSYCFALQSVDLPEGLVSFGSNCFYYCTSLTSYTIPSSCKAIADHAFYYCTSLESIYIPSTVNTIGFYAFSECNSVTSVTIDGDIKSIYQAFIGLDNLTELTINGDIDYIGSRDNMAIDFSSTKLQRAVFNGNVGGIGYGTFCCNAEMTDVIFNGDVGTIDKFAFSMNKALTNVLFCGNLGSINDSTFNNCYVLRSYSVSDDNMYLVLDEYGVMYNKAQTIIYRQPSAWDYNGVYVMPNTVTTLPDYCFGYDQNNLVSTDTNGPLTQIGGNLDVLNYRELLTGVVLSSNLKNLPVNCFIRFSSLESVTYGGENVKLKSIAEQAFYECSSLKFINFCEGLVSIERYAFAYCTSLEEIYLPESLKSLGEAAFGYCTSLTTAVLPSNLIDFNLDLVFIGCTSLSNIIVDNDNPYFTTINGVLFSKDMTVLIKYTQALSNTTYVVPEGVLKIGANAFAGNAVLERVILPTTLEVIGDCAFYNTPNLKYYVFLSENAPTLECLNDDTTRLDYRNFGTRIGDAVGLYAYFPQNGKYYYNYIWQMFFENI